MPRTTTLSEPTGGAATLARGSKSPPRLVLPRHVLLGSSAGRVLDIPTPVPYQSCSHLFAPTPKIAISVSRRQTNSPQN